MIPDAVAVAVAAVGGSALLSGLLIAARRIWPAGLLLAATGGLTVAGTVLESTGHADAAKGALVAAGMLVFPLALLEFPRAAHRQLVDVLSLTAVTGAGLVALRHWDNPDVVGTMSVVSALFVTAHTWWRLEQGSPADRWPLVWMSLGVVVPGLVFGFVTFAAPNTTGIAVAFLVLALVGPAMYVGVARPEVVDVRGLVVHAVVFAFAATAYMAAFMVLASLLEIIGGDAPLVGGLAIVGLLVAVTFHPLQVVLRGVVDELMFGHRPDPLDAAANVVGAISDDPVLALGTIREALVLPYAALSANGVLIAASGTAVTHTRNWALSLGGERVAELVVGLRAGDLALSPGDEHVLRLVAPLLAQAMRARRLAADLQASREETITALEEERRRLRRDLHDGLGPRLSGIAFTSDAARNTLRQDPDAADTLLAAIRAETVTAISEIRQLVYGMRPPALDELGLVPAVRQQAAALHTRDNRSFGVRIEASNLPPLPAAVEVAAYRIVVEALTNAARHSGARTATACLSVVDAALVVEVRDGGFGAGAWSPGVGITSMRERAAELGGTLTVDHSAGGTVVRAALPLQR
ncbi:MAG: hypothetical protein QOE40_1984 [Actinomycetota bacterium]|nr:hypothetical protein [Actinomycetota bacterium]